jgi:CHAT domain-containing protein
MSIFRKARTAALMLVGMFIFRSDLQDFKIHQVDFLLRQISEAHLAAGGRLTSMPYPSGRIENLQSFIRSNGILPRHNDGSVFYRKVLSLVYILDGQLQGAQRELKGLSLEVPNDAGVHNDLGVVEMELAVSSPTAWLDALSEFETADSLRPNFPEAKFNLIVAYRHLGLTKQLAAATDRYERIEPSSSWRSQLKNSGKPREDAAALLERLETARREEISELVRRYPSNVRQVILKFAFHPVLPIPPSYACAADELSRQYGDETAKAAFAGLSTDDVQSIVRMRDLVARGRQEYERGRIPESLTLHEAALQVSARTNSMFDHVWVEINAADALLLLRKRPQARSLYQDAIGVSRRHGLKWLWARALSSIGSSPILAGGVINAKASSEEAVQLYREIGETSESARPLYFVAAIHSVAGSYDESLRFALECLNVSDPGDHFRRSAAHLLISQDLNWMGRPRMAIYFDEEAAGDAVKLDNPVLIARTKIELASAYLESNREHEAAAQLQEAKRLFPRMSAADRGTAEVPLNLIHARLAIQSGQLQDAESELRNSIEFAETLYKGGAGVYNLHIVLAEALAGRGRNAEAAAQVRKAIELVESDQDKLPKDKFQINFDHERRPVYDTAIRLTYRQSGCQEAWNLAQQYKAKLFLNAMQGFGPSPGGKLRYERATLDHLQRRIPNTLHIVDYIALRDELLVWVISQNDFHCESVPVTAARLQEKVALFVSQVLARQSSDKTGQELYDVLVQPIDHLLEPSHSVVIVPDGPLYRLPFSALRSRAGQYWIETAAIAQTPSVTYLLAGVGRRPPPASHIAFGSRRYDAWTNAELNAIRQTDAALRLQTGLDVNKDNFLKALRENSVLYYAGHSAFDIRNALQSSILLDGDRPGPNMVSALDIMQQHIRKNAVILLSSCESSVGNATDGAGIGGLTSAFLLGGAGAVVGSLWPVESASTMQLMSGAFDSLIRQGQSPAESLRAAKIELLRNRATRDPYYWSGFVLTGNWSAAKP